MALGVSGLAYRASGPAVAQAAPEGDKAPSELEALRRKVELLQINLDVVLEKVRAQEAELKTLRARAAVSSNTSDAQSKRLAEFLSGALTAGDATLHPHVGRLLLQADDGALKKFGARGSGVAAAADPLAALEAALRSRAGATDKDAARQADVRIQKALDELRALLKQGKPAGPEKK
jgi:hypothetical protein